MVTPIIAKVKESDIGNKVRKAKGKAGIEGVTFHDSRHTAATWLAPRMDVLDLCKMFGWSNPKQAMTYYNPTASQIAARIKTFTPTLKKP
jgi:integrase